jgi:hypothetical protein
MSSLTSQISGSAYLVARAGEWSHLGRGLFLGGHDTCGNKDDSLFGVGAEDENNAILSQAGNRDVIPSSGRFGDPDWEWIERMRGWHDEVLFYCFSLALCSVLRTKRIGAAIIDNFRTNAQPVFRHDWTNRRDEEDPTYLGRFANNHAASRRAADDIKDKIKRSLTWRERSSLSTTLSTLDRLLDRTGAPSIDFEANWKNLAAWDHLKEILSNGTLPGAIRRLWDDLTNDPGQYNQELTLKAIIGGTQGLQAGLQNIFTRRNSSGGVAGLRYDLIISVYDVFGCGGDDTYSVGLVPFFLLQHERGFRPFKQQLRIAFRGEEISW